jgi:hypothetical protein
VKSEIYARHRYVVPPNGNSFGSNAGYGNSYGRSLAFRSGFLRQSAGNKKDPHSSCGLDSVVFDRCNCALGCSDIAQCDQWSKPTS